MDRQTAKLNSPPNFPAIYGTCIFIVRCSVIATIGYYMLEYNIPFPISSRIISLK